MTRMRRTRPLTPQALRAARTRQLGGPLFLSRRPCGEQRTGEVTRSSDGYPAVKAGSYYLRPASGSVHKWTLPGRRSA
jgi:hypothetical protein